MTTERRDPASSDAVAESRIGVIVADDEERFRRVLLAIIAGEDDIAVLAQAKDGGEAVSRCQEFVPDLILLDVRMPGMDGIEAATIISRLLPTTKIVMLTASDEDEDVYEALKAGASGYLLKEDLLNDLPGAVRAVAQGLGLLLAPSIATKLLVELREPSRPGSGDVTLTEREVGVLRLVSQGHPNHEIAQELHLSSHTVKRHVANILAKLHQRSRMDAVMHAMRTGVLTAEAS